MASIVFLQSARRDLEKIADYIAQDSPSRALAFVQTLRQECENLNTFPRRHKIDPDLDGDIRKKSYKEYNIYYHFDEESDCVSIIVVTERHKLYPDSLE